MTTLTVGELADRAQRVAEFDGEDVRESVEQFGEPELRQLLDRREMVNTLIGHVRKLQDDMNGELVDRREAI